MLSLKPTRMNQYEKAVITKVTVGSTKVIHAKCTWILNKLTSLAEWRNSIIKKHIGFGKEFAKIFLDKLMNKMEKKRGTDYGKIKMVNAYQVEPWYVKNFNSWLI